MKKLIRLMENLPQGLDAALITDSVNRLYYTEFKSSAGTIVVTREKSYLIIDSRYHEEALNKAVNCEVVLQENLQSQIVKLLKQHNVKNIGIENQTVSLAAAAEIKKWLEGFNVVEDGTLSDHINKQRSVKCPTELEYIQISQDITDKTFDYALTIIQPGKTELEIALAMEFFSRNIGSEEAAFSFIIASGPNASKPHAVPGERKIQSGEFLLMDFGSTYKGYRSDMTRTVAVGVPSQKQKEVYNIVLEAQQKAMSAIKPGVVCSDVHKMAASVIDATEYKGKFTHGLGHSLGLDIHENPRFSMADNTITQPGMVFSVEPGIYLPGEFGVRIEDIISITDDGYNNFTKSTKELLVL